MTSESYLIPQRHNSSEDRDGMRPRSEIRGGNFNHQGLSGGYFADSDDLGFTSLQDQTSLYTSNDRRSSVYSRLSSQGILGNYSFLQNFGLADRRKTPVGSEIGVSGSG